MILKAVPLKKKEAPKSYQMVMNQIRQMIMDGGLKEGDRLMSERELAETLGVSRTVVREALKALELLGVVEVRAGGTYIRAPDLKNILETFTYSLALDRVAIYELLETRKMIEIQAAKLAAERRTESDLSALAEILQTMKEALQENDFEKNVEADYKFHYQMVKACQNRVLIRLIETISGLYQEVLSVTRQELRKFTGIDAGIYRQHLAIYKAIRDRDVQLAEKSITEHLHSLEEELQMIEKGLEDVPSKYESIKDVDLDDESI
jgi:GntR family transcriptional repressor for pyruvate dehydrogenase complex